MSGRPIPILLGVSLLWALGGAGPAAEPDPKGVEFFENKIRPVLVNNCYECHSAKAAKVRASLLLDTRDGVLKGGESGPAIVPGKPAESLLLKSLRRDGDLKMPPKNPLPAGAIADIEKWIAMGAPDPRTGGTAYKRLSLEEAKSFWSLVPVRKPAAPKAARNAWPRTDADRFILAKLQEKGL